MVAYVPAGIRIGTRHFSGLGKVATTERDSLANIIRGLSYDINRTRIETAKLTAFTDNSTGTKYQSPAVFVDLGSGAYAVSLHRHRARLSGISIRCRCRHQRRVSQHAQWDLHG
jgi:hypothetical protein